RDLALMTAREHGNVGRALELRASTIVTLFARCDAFRKPQRFLDMLAASEYDHRRRTGYDDVQFPQRPHPPHATQAAQTVDAGKIAEWVRQRYPDQLQRVPEAIRAARVEAVAKAVKQDDG